jgi:integrase
MRLGEDPRARLRQQQTLCAALDAYLTGRRSLKASTAAGYRAVVGRHLADWLDKPLREIDREMVARRHMAITDKAGGSSANQVFRVFRAIYSFAADADEALPVNPVSTLKRRWFKIERRERMVEQQDLAAFHAAVLALENPVVRDYVLLLLYTGMRRREAAGLSWGDVDFTARTLTIPGSRTKNGVALRLPMASATSGWRPAGWRASARRQSG